MEQIPIIVSSTLGNQPKSIASSSRTVSLLLPGMLVLEPTTDPSRLELRKEPVFVNLDGQNPATSKEIDVPRQLAFVCQAQRTVIQL